MKEWEKIYYTNTNQKVRCVAGGLSSVVKHILSMCDSLGSILSTLSPPKKGKA
jgi:hypothetical protein